MRSAVGDFSLTSGDFRLIFVLAATMDANRTYEFRCPVHGFVKLNDWERAIVDHPAFQRLRRIRQLAWTDYVYPGASHSRFEHSLGVMHTASRLYDAVWEKSQDILTGELRYNRDGLQRHRQLVRLAALLHDVGHAPFSHASEDLFPRRSDGERYQHEEYTAAIIRSELRDVIENHPANTANYGFRAEDIAALVQGATGAKQALFWRQIISGQMDADRMDYLLRDSLHAGVRYGSFDLNRIAATVVAVPDPEAETLRLGVSEGGAHAAEALVLARYFMFTQVYFHKTRVAFDHHLKGALAAMLPGGLFPSPVDADLHRFLEWDDWKVLGQLPATENEHAKRLAQRNHYREIFHTQEVPNERDRAQLEQLKNALGLLLAAEASAGKSWYKSGPSDIPVVSEALEGQAIPLSLYSNVVGHLKPNAQVLLYVRPEDVEIARAKKREVLGEEK